MWRSLLLALVFFTFAGCDEQALSDTVTVTAYTSVNCVPCRRNEPGLRQLEAQGVSITRIDVDRRPDLARQAGVYSWPTYVVEVNGNEVGRTNDLATLAQLIAIHGPSP